jgi:hypothetical protein
MKNYIGRNIRGFRFKHETDGVEWTKEKKNHIGEVGVIEKQKHGYVTIQFKDDYWDYPISLIEEHLIPESPEIPQLGEGVEMEVSNDHILWYTRNIIAQMQDGWYIINDGTIWKYARPIHKVKKYTKEELVKILGHDFEMV